MNCYVEIYLLKIMKLQTNILIFITGDLNLEVFNEFGVIVFTNQALVCFRLNALEEQMKMQV